MVPSPLSCHFLGGPLLGSALLTEGSIKASHVLCQPPKCIRVVLGNTAKSTRKARQDICSMRPRKTFASWHGSCGGKSGCSIATANQRVGLGLHVSSSFWKYPDVSVSIHWVTGSMPGQMPPHAYVEWKGAGLSKNMLTRRAGFFVGCSCIYTWQMDAKWWKSAYPTLPTQQKFTLLPEGKVRMKLDDGADDSVITSSIHNMPLYCILQIRFCSLYHWRKSRALMLGSAEVGVHEGLCWVFFHHQAAKLSNFLSPTSMELLIDWGVCARLRRLQNIRSTACAAS